MNKLSILLLIYLLSVTSSQAVKLEPGDVLFSSSGASVYLLDINHAKINLTTLSKFPKTAQFTSENDAVPPTSWIVGLGLCLVFLGYKIKKSQTNYNKSNSF